MEKQVLRRMGFDTNYTTKTTFIEPLFLMPIFQYNLLTLKEKQLLVLDEKRGLSEKVPSRWS